MPMEQHVAILGGGAAGLSAAYFLHGRTSKDGKWTFRCTVFDVRERLGGNVFSAYLGEAPYQKPFVDLGVNDFNTKRYHNFMALLQQLAEDGYPVPHAPLIDTTTWYTPRSVTSNARVYTNAEMEDWEMHSDKPWLGPIAKDWNRFQDTAHKVIKEPKYQRMSVDTFIKDERYSDDFAQYNLLARINGMYYVNGLSPGEMPIRAIMNYYQLQEGIGEEKKTYYRCSARTEPSPRHYFVNGASDWIHQLVKCLIDRGVDLRLGAAPTAAPDGAHGWLVQSPASPLGAREQFDHVISAVHADQVSRVITDGLPGGMNTLLGQFQYLDSIAIVHDDVDMLPADPASWSDYNILIYPPDTYSLRPYTITYIDRKHQGQDSNEPPYLTLTPFGAISRDKVPEMLNLPCADRVKAVAYLRHNTLSVDAMAAQARLSELQGDSLWFTGGWANGAGLHEEIISLSKEIALRIRRFYDPIKDGETYRAGDPFYVPKHLQESFGSTPKPFVDGFWT